MSEHTTPKRRSSMFARSDIRSAAEEFVEAVAEHADIIWTPKDIDDLAEALTDKAFLVMTDPAETF